MASVTLVSPSGREFAVSTVKGFVDAVYGRGAVPKVGGVRANYEALQGAAAPVESPLEHVTLADLQSSTSSARAALRTAFAHLNDDGELVITIDGVETVIGGAGGGGLTAEQVRDLVGTTIIAGTNITKVVDDTDDTVTLSATGGGSYTDEQVRDAIAAALVAGSGVTITPNDAGDTITISATGGGGGGSFDSALTQIYTTSLTSQPATGQPVATLNAVTNLAPGWTVMLGSDVNTAERRTVLSVAGNDVTFTSNIVGVHPTTEQVSYSNKPIDLDYLTTSTYQQVTGGKDFRGLLRYQRPAPADPTAAVDYLDLVNTVLRSRAQGGGGVCAKGPLDQSAGVIDWYHAGTLANSGYLMHLTHVLRGGAKGTLMGIGVQGDGGGGILIAKDGPKGIGLYIDQKPVVTDPAALGMNGQQGSFFAPLVSLGLSEPSTAPVLRFVTTGHTTIPGEHLLEWLAPGGTAQGFIDAQSGWMTSRGMPFFADNSVNNTNAGFWFRGRQTSAWTNTLMLDELGPRAAGTSDAGAGIRWYSGSAANPYSGQVRLSSISQGIMLSAGNGAARPGAEAPETVADFGAATATGVRLGFGHDVTVAPLAIPSTITLTGAGATGGSTTYGYRVAAVNAKGTTIASTTVTTAVGQAALSAGSPIVVNWAASLGASSYKVYGRTSGSELLLGTVTVPSRTITGATMYAAASRTVTDAVSTVGTSVITSATAAFTAADVGAQVYLTSGGGLGPGYLGFETYGHITAVNSATSATVSAVVGASLTGVSLTISNPAMNRVTTSAAQFTAADVGKGVAIPVGAASALVYGIITTYESTTSVLVSFTATTTMTAGSFTLTGGTVPLTFTDDGTVTPAGALPGNPVGSTSKVTPWVSQTADVAQWQDNSASPVTTQRINKNGRLVFKVGTAPVLADLADGEATLWTDTDGTLKVTTRVAGALKTGSVAVA